MTNISKRNTPIPPSKEEFCRYCNLLYERHLVTGVGGNVSVRVRNQIFLTPSGYSLRDVVQDLVVTVDAGGKVIDGGTPTKDANMHLAVLRARSDVNVVCHIHGAHIVAATSMLQPGPDTLPPLTPGFVYFAHPLPMIPFMPPGSPGLAESVTEILSRENSRAIFLQNHGLVTVGTDFQEAFNIAEEIDEAARIYVLTGGKARAIPLDDLNNTGSS